MNRRVRLVAAIAALALVACGPEGALPTDGAAPGQGPELARARNFSVITSTTQQSAGGIVLTLLATCPQAGYDSTAANLGKWGGTLQLGKYKLTVPAGALDATVQISMVRPADGTASLRFHPHGLVFPNGARPVVSLNYAGCTTGLAPSIVYVTESLSLLEALPTLGLDLKNKSVSAYLDHFSRYAVAW